MNRNLECQGGMLIVPEDCGKPDFAGWWAELSDDDRGIIKDIPNFDPVKWKMITGIDVDAD